ncbi:MAG: methyltransferase [Caldilineaceae bacterium]
MPITPNLVERLLFSPLNQAPGPLLDIWSAVGFRVVLAAVRLQIFDALLPAPLSAPELAQKLQLDAQGTTVLLETLVALGYVHKVNDRYANTAMTEKWLTSSAAVDFSAYVRYWGGLLTERWADLEASLRTGQPATDLYAWLAQQPQTAADFQAGMAALAQFLLPEITSKLELPPDIQRLLDVGGGHAFYSIALCRQYPQLTATVFDSPQALQAAAANVARAKLEQRITLQAGDFRLDHLGENYDVVLLFNLIHGFTPEVNGHLFAKVSAALRPGGRVVILEQLAGGASTRLGHTLSQLLDISYFHLLGGQVYLYREVTQWLKEAGFIRIQRIKLVRTPGNYLLIGTKVS